MCVGEDELHGVSLPCVKILEMLSLSCSAFFKDMQCVYSAKHKSFLLGLGYIVMHFFCYYLYLAYLHPVFRFLILMFLFALCVLVC